MDAKIRVERSVAVPAYRLGHAILVLALVFLCACAAPIGVKGISPGTAQRSLTANILSTGKLSQRAEILLRRTNALEDWEDDPEGVITRLHAKLSKPANAYDTETRIGYLDAAAELCFAHAARTDDSRYYLAAAVFAWMYLFPASQEFQSLPLNRGRRLAADLYNRGISLGLSDPDTGDVILRDGVYELPFGSLTIDFDEESLRWGDRQLARFTSVADLRVTGMLNRYRASGLGAPLAASVGAPGDSSGVNAIFSTVKVPVSALLRLDGVESDVASGDSHFEAGLSVVAYSDSETVEIGGEAVPLAFEPSATLALQLTEAPPWKRELTGFFRGDLAIEKGGLLSLAPYQPGRIPLVLVHGTASSAGRWADMVNDLWSDPVIRRNYHVLLFSYNTGNPIAYSASLLRNAIEGLAKSVDPEGLDPALGDMVMMGHSQGGLLTKLMVVDSGDLFWDLVSDEAPDEVDLEPDSRELLEGALLVKPLERVKRVIFLSTPHRGSHLATWGLTRLVGRLVRSPANIVNATVELVGGDDDAEVRRRLERGSGAVGNMSPGSKFLQTLAELPIEPPVLAHSIIGVKKEPKETGGDGVVSYQSAHLDGVESEKVVKSGHSSQSNPVVVSEVRRILLEHLQEVRSPVALSR